MSDELLGSNDGPAPSTKSSRRFAEQDRHRHARADRDAGADQARAQLVEMIKKTHARAVVVHVPQLLPASDLIVFILGPPGRWSSNTESTTARYLAGTFAHRAPDGSALLVQRDEPPRPNRPRTTLAACHQVEHVPIVAPGHDRWAAPVDVVRRRFWSKLITLALCSRRYEPPATPGHTIRRAPGDVPRSRPSETDSGRRRHSAPRAYRFSMGSSRSLWSRT